MERLPLVSVMAAAAQAGTAAMAVLGSMAAAAAVQLDIILLKWADRAAQAQS